MAIIITALASLFFPLVGPIIAIGLTKSKQSEAAAAARKAAIALLIVTIIVAAVFGSGIL